MLIVEDECLLAAMLAQDLQGLGFEIAGPIARVGEALERVSADSIDAAVLDINIHGEEVYPVADALAEGGVPFVFATSMSEKEIPERFADIRRFGKPADAHEVVKALAQKLAPGRVADWRCANLISDPGIEFGGI